MVLTVEVAKVGIDVKAEELISTVLEIEITSEMLTCEDMVLSWLDSAMFEVVVVDATTEISDEIGSELNQEVVTTLLEDCE